MLTLDKTKIISFVHMMKSMCAEKIRKQERLLLPPERVPSVRGLGGTNTSGFLSSRVKIRTEAPTAWGDFLNMRFQFDVNYFEIGS